ETIARKRQIAASYHRLLTGVPGLVQPIEEPYAACVYWMYHVGLIGPAASTRVETMRRLDERGIETREGFVPANLQNIFQAQGWTGEAACPRANAAAYTTFYLPSHPSLADHEVEYIAKSL